MTRLEVDIDTEKRGERTVISTAHRRFRQAEPRRRPPLKGDFDMAKTDIKLPDYWLRRQSTYDVIPASVEEELAKILPEPTNHGYPEWWIEYGNGGAEGYELLIHRCDPRHAHGRGGQVQDRKVRHAFHLYRQGRGHGGFRRDDVATHRALRQGRRDRVHG